MGSLGVLRKTTMVCVPLMSHSVEQLVGDMFQAKNEGADLVEIRLDFLKEFDPVKDLRTIVGCRPLPIVVVYRPKWDGGFYDGDEKSRLEALMLAKELGAEYIDLELQVASDIMEEHKLGQQSSSKIIVSCFVDRITSLKEDLSHLVTRMQSTGAHIIKLVATAADITELSKIFHLLSHCQIPLIAYSTGERGLISHLLGPKFGGVIVYGSLEGKQVAGLPTLASLREAYGVENIDADTKVFGLISKPVSHSKGPILHNPTFRHVGFNGVYVPMFVDDLKQFFNVYQSPDFAGYSVGIPYKEAVMEFCDEVHPLAQSIGAVNTIVKRHSDGKLIGYNTDCEASITAIEDALKARGLVNGEASLPSPLTGKQFVLAGAGGAGRALSFGAKIRGARVIVFDIDYDRAKSLALAVSGEARPFEELANFKPEKGAVLANATPIGMHPNKNRIPVPEETLRDYSVVFDAVYTPRKTTLLTDAEAAGAIIVSGVEMFLRQAVGQFNLFTGGKAPEEFMRDIVLSKF
ncbi:putative 3-dehydroquinate dehydratase, Shikimate dehydrogenase [Helianthus annuus]|uniref:3-dehydroquinate dehydratase, Shikimate dehydrogenase n=1 Tax=Helianthus annuus TaxID=4232 RepID=A0A251TVZ3_HELAN|nr:bifunctional 3-dehydroquinate dehydratase/shikimate dehydrogenase, chloroplastic [Helianthus annuus]KAF5790684.1 putative 3-dehydroquinate dehydratase, Shikimate dehydrogenase [Helianthus annuus]